MSEENQESVPVTAEQQINALNKVIEEMAEHMEELQAKLKSKEDWSISSPSIKGVALALSKAQPEWADGVVETGRNPHFKRPDGTPSTFQQLGDLVAKAGPILAKNGLAVTQKTVPKETSAGVRMFLVTTILHGATDTWLRGYWPMSPERKGQQALASEHTYSKRQGYGGMLVIPPAEDDDGEASEGRGK